MSNFRFEQEYIQPDLFDAFDNTDRNGIVNTYVSNLVNSKTKVIFDTQHLSKLVGYSEYLLYAISASPRNFYHEYKIKKKAGGVRTINEPLTTLKYIQKFILHSVLQEVEPHKAAKAYRKNHTLRGAATIHKGRPFMLKIDISDFFPSIKSYAVFDIFYNLGYTSQISRLLSGICTLNDSLPQGAPTSPHLSNLYMKQFDEFMFQYCTSIGIFYTRYADDMTFSSKVDILLPLIKVVRDELKKLQLRVNDKKTNYSRPGSRKYVNGIVVNEKLNILKYDRKNLRQTMHYIRKFGINGHIRAKNIYQKNYIDSLLGKLNHAYFVTREEKFLNDIHYLLSVKNFL